MNKTTTLKEAESHKQFNIARKALETLFDQNELDYMTERELRKLSDRLTSMLNDIVFFEDEVLAAIDHCEPEQHECTFCDTFNTQVDYDYDEVTVWCKEGDHWTHIEPEWNPDESQESIDRNNSGAIESSDRTFMKAGW